MTVIDFHRPTSLPFYLPYRFRIAILALRIIKVRTSYRLPQSVSSFGRVTSRISPFIYFILFLSTFGTGAQANQHPSSAASTMNANNPNLLQSTSLRAEKVACSPTSKPRGATAVPITKKNVQHETAIHVTSKRDGYLSWDDYFMAVACLSSKRSKDPKSPSGACIVDQKNRIVGIGYSGFPRGCSDSVFPWNDNQGGEWLHSKDPYICQSVSNAILNKCTSDVAGARIYVMEYPNSESAKVIIQSGIQEVVVLGSGDMVENDEDLEIQAGRILLDMANVNVRFFQPDPSKLCLDFGSKMSPVAELPDSLPHQDSVVLEGSERRESEKQRVAREALLEEANYDASKVHDNGKSADSISWQDYFMAMAFLTAQRSKDPNTQVGACIVDGENRIVGLGYNGFPSGCSDDLLPWARSNSNGLHNKYLFVCHAEVNAILNKGSANVKDATIYVALFPCQNCAKMIIQSGIKEVVFMSDAYHHTAECRASRIMFRCAGVKLRQYTPSTQQLLLDLGKSKGSQ